MQSINEVNHITADDFFNQVIPAGKPLVIRNFISNWPLVQAAQQSPEAFCNYIMRFDRGMEFNTMSGAPSVAGRIFYNADMSALNCRQEQKRLAASLDFILKSAATNPAPTLAIQSVPIAQYLAGMQYENQLSLLPASVEPRIWIGNKTIVAAHFDTSENLACCVAGQRTFTLFPTEQIENLYIGPLEFTPSGATVSMVDFDAPDFEKYPKFKQALDNAYRAELNPGDIIYIPYLWWHHVKATSTFNALVNYWWTPTQPAFGDPRNAMLHSMMALRNFPQEHKQAWQQLFNYYVFNNADEAYQHIPEQSRGILGKTSTDIIQSLKNTLMKALHRIN